MRSLYILRPVLLPALILVVFGGAKIFANTYAPNTFTDPVITSINNATGAINGGSTISLRSALTAADNLGGTHIVNLSTGTYVLTQAIPNRQITIGNRAENITINGNGPTNTIISGTLDANKDRILFINPTGSTNSPVITINGVKFQNGYLTSDTYGGAAICSGGGSAESLTITNSAFDNNVLPANAYGGAAVNMQVRGNLSIDGSTFTNNVSNDADGGAVLFIIFGSALGNGYGTLSVTNSTFTNNSVNFPGAGSANGGALAFTGQGGNTPFNVTITGNTFTNNSADGYGGAVSANNSPAVSVAQIHYNRFVGNTSGVNAITSGMLFVNSSGSVNAENNWWGCNSNPVNSVSTAPCDQVNGIGASGGGTLDANPWLQLRTAASPSSIVTNQTSALTASFLANSDGTAIPVGNLGTLIGRTVAWSSVGGTLSGQQTSIQASGTATATYNETTGVAGTHSGTAIVDSAPASGSFNTAAITVNKANTTAAVTSNLSTATVTGQSYTVAYSVTGAFGNSPTAPTGNVQVSDGTSTCTGTVAAGSCSLTSTSAGVKTITATYLAGDANFNASAASPGVSHTVNKADTTVAVTNAVNNPSVYGQSVTFTATISVTSPGAGSPTGNVTFRDNGVDIGTCVTQTVAASAATCTVSNLSVATHPITAVYNSDANFNASPASPALSQVVNKAATTTSVTSSLNSSIYGQQVTFTATVGVTAPGAGNRTGNVAFKDGGVDIPGCATQPLNGSFQATCVISTLGAGNHTISGVYAGDTNFLTSSGNMTGNPQVVNKAATTLAVASNHNPAFKNQVITFTATISVTAPGGGSPGSTVQFLDNAVAIPSCNAVTVSAGQAQCMISTLAPGNHPISAVYGGDTNFVGSNATLTGNPQVVTVLTASSVTISGRVLSAEGRAVRGGVVTITDEEGTSRSVAIGPRGEYSIPDVESGRTYVITVVQRRFTFQPKVMEVNDELTDLDLVAEPQ